MTLPVNDPTRFDPARADLVHVDPDPVLSRRALRRVVTQALAILGVLLALALAIDGPAETARPWSVRIIAFAVLVVLGVGLAEAYLRVATRLWPSGRVPVPVNIIAAILGSVLGYTVAEFIAIISGGPLTPVSWTTVIDTLIVGPVWILLIGTAVLTRWRYLTERDSLMVELIRSETLRREESGLLEVARQSFRRPISDSVVTLREGITQQLTRALASTSDFSAFPGHRHEALEAADTLRRSAQDIIRPLSHAIWQQTDLPPSPRQPLRFLARVVSTQPFRPGLVAAVYIASALTTNVSLYGIGAGALYLATDVAFIVAVLGAANVSMRRWPPAHVGIYLGTLIVIHVLPFLPKIAGLEETSPQVNATGRIAEILISVALIVGTSSLGLLREGRQARLAALRREVNTEWLQRAADAHDIATYARSLAVSLHGPVQSTLITAAAAIDAAVESRDAQSVARTLADVTRALDQIPDLDEQTPAHTRPLSVQVHEMIESWRELCSLDVSIDPTVGDLTGTSADTITSVIREGITNAYRHGDARHVTLSISEDPAGYLITITDDGVGPVAKIWGLGLTTIDRASHGRWTLTREGIRTVLNVVIPPS